MRDFDEYKTSVVEKQLEGGKKIFKIQLNGAEGKNIEIDGELARGILLNHLNDMSTSKDQRGLNIELTTNIKKGSFVKDLIEDKTYLVMSNIDNHYAYKTCTLDYCNQELNWKGLDKPIPCYCDNSSYGTKGTIDTNYLIEYDGKILFYTQYNEKTKQIRQDMRFIFDNNKDSAYQVVDVNRVVTGNVLRIVMDKTKADERDDVENNIAYNEFLEGDSDIPTPNQGYFVKSYTDVYQINKWDLNMFTVCKDDGVEDNEKWNITVGYNGNPESVIIINSITDNSITIKNNGFIGTSIILKFTKGDIELMQEVRLVK